MITRIATEADINGIVELQSLNLYANLSSAELEQGFVTTPITVEQIETILAQSGVFIAEAENKLVGYAFAGSWDFFSQWAIFPHMLSRLVLLEYKGIKLTTDNTFQYGPVCIARTLRGSGTFPQLFQTMRSNLAQQYPIGITFINKLNQRSLKAHIKLGLEIIDQFEFNNSSYYTLAFETKYN